MTSSERPLLTSRLFSYLLGIFTFSCVTNIIVDYLWPLIGYDLISWVMNELWFYVDDVHNVAKYRLVG